MTPETPEAFIVCFKTLSIGTLPKLQKLCTPDIHFRDPFTDLHGIEPYIQLYARMLASLMDPRFVILDRAISGEVCYVRWTFRFRLPKEARERSIEGVSELRFAPDGRVAEHIDYWDSGTQVFAHIPVLGALVRFIAKRIADPSGGSIFPRPRHMPGRRR
jgi:hypothetical protein